MDRLEEIKKARKDYGKTIYLEDVDWLISEIGRLRKEAEKACRVIDTFITLFFLRQDKMDYNVVSDGLRLIKKRMKENLSYPITVALKEYIDKH